jgi:hypothetical protein
MRPVTDAPRTPDSDAASDHEAAPPEGGERRLPRPPSERYGSWAGVGSPAAASSAESDPGSPVRGIAFGAVAALVGAAAIVVLGGVFAVSAGLLVAAATIGYAAGFATLAGAGGTLSSPGRPATAAALAGLGVALGQVGLWLYARTEGGVLPLIDYLGQTFGALVPLELLLAVLVAWWRAR